MEVQAACKPFSDCDTYPTQKVTMHSQVAPSTLARSADLSLAWHTAGTRGRPGSPYVQHQRAIKSYTVSNYDNVLGTIHNLVMDAQ